MDRHQSSDAEFCETREMRDDQEADNRGHDEQTKYHTNESARARCSVFQALVRQHEDGQQKPAEIHQHGPAEISYVNGSANRMADNGQQPSTLNIDGRKPAGEFQPKLKSNEDTTRSYQGQDCR